MDPKILAAVMQRMQPSSQPASPQVGAAPPPGGGVPPGPPPGGVPQGMPQGGPQQPPQVPVNMQGTMMISPAQMAHPAAPGGPSMDNSTIGGTPAQGGPLGAGPRPMQGGWPPNIPTRG